MQCTFWERKRDRSYATCPFPLSPHPIAQEPLRVSIGVPSRDWEGAVGDPKKATLYGKPVKVYRIPNGTFLYHGTSADITASHITARSNWFGTKSTADMYRRMKGLRGVIYKFQLIRDVYLLALDDCETIGALSKIFSSDTTIQNIFRQAFRCTRGDGGSPVRDSLGPRDNVIVKKLCDHAIHGYAAMPMRNTGDKPMFHAEVFFCEPKLFLRRSRVST